MPKMKMGQHISINPWPYGYKAAVVIRDDDTCYFTSQHKIERIYERVWERGFKVSLAVIPKVKTINDPLIPPRYRGKMSEHPIYNNRELTDYLKEKVAKQKVDIVQHGYNHEKLHGTPEFCIRDLSEIKNRLKLGRKNLESSFSIKIKVFVPPWNRVSKQAWNALKQEGLALCRKEKRISGLIKNTPWSLDNFTSLMKILSSKIFSHTTHPFAKGIIKFPGMIELRPSLDWWKSKNFSKRIKDTYQKFNEIMGVSGLICIVNHYWFYYEDWQDNVSNEETLQHFYALLDFLATQNLWKTTLTEVVNWIKKIDKVKIKVKKRKGILKSTIALQGVTIKGKNCMLTPTGKADVEVKKQGDTVLLIYKKLNAGESKIIISDS